MGLGHVPPRPLREAGEGDDLPRHQHRGAGAELGDLRSRPSLARFGEDLAARFLVSRGGRILARNLRVGRGELDLLVTLDGRPVAVEVKTVGPTAMGDPIDRITPDKLRQVRALANAVSPRYGRMRVDFVGIALRREGVRINWRRDVA